MDINEYKKKASLIRDTSVYKVYDLAELKNLVLSRTELHAGQKTSGHSHEEADEVYFFTDGKGKMEIGEETMDCKQGDVFLVPRGKFHRVRNTADSDLIFWAVFEKYGERK